IEGYPIVDLADPNIRFVDPNLPPSGQPQYTQPLSTQPPATMMPAYVPPPGNVSPAHLPLVAPPIDVPVNVPVQPTGAYPGPTGYPAYPVGNAPASESSYGQPGAASAGQNRGY